MQAERRVTRGGAIVRTAEGEVDATLETKLARAREVLEDELAAPLSVADSACDAASARRRRAAPTCTAAAAASAT